MGSSAVSRQRHRGVAVVAAIIFPAEAHLAVVDGQQAAIGDGNAMCVPANVAEDRPKSGRC